MPILSTLAAALLHAVVASPAQAAECPNCALDFPSSWQAEEHPWGTRVTIDGQDVDVEVQPDETVQPLGAGDVDDELVWLTAELEAEGRSITSKNGRIVRTASREPAVVLDYAWSDEQGGSGKGVRLVRRCGVRLILEQQSAEIRLDALLSVSERVRYTRSECVSLNADVIPLEVLEGIDKVTLPDVSDVVPQVTTPVEPADEPEPADAEAPPPQDAEPAQSARDGSSTLTTLLLAVGLLLLAGLVVLMVRGGRDEPLEGLPPARPRDDDEAASSDLASSIPSAQHRREAAMARLSGEHRRDRGAPVASAAHRRDDRVGERHPEPPPPRSVDESPPVGLDREHPSSDEFGDEDTDAILPSGTYGLRGAGGGDRSEQVRVAEGETVDARAPAEDDRLELHAVPAMTPPPSRDRGPLPDDAPISVPSHAVVSYPSVSRPSHRGIEVGDAPSYDEDDLVRVSPVESVIASLGITTWLDFTAPGIAGITYLPSSIAALLEVQNGGRFGYGWLLLLGLRRKNMDLMTLNGEARVKARFGEGWIVGVFAFGNVLWVNPDQSWEIVCLDGERHALGDTPEGALRRLAEDPGLRDLGASKELVDRCRNAVGELLPGWVYRYHGEVEDAGDAGFEPVEIVPFLELLA